MYLFDTIFGIDFNCETWDYDQNDCTELMGDVNFDGDLNVLDIVIIVNIVLLNNYNELADINIDGIVNVLDIVQLVNIILNN